MSPILIMSALMIFMMLVMILMMASRYVKVPPNKAMVVYGHKFKGNEGMMIQTGGGRFIMPIIESWGWLNLEVKTLNIQVPGIITRDHHVVHMECTAQVQIDPSEDNLRTSAVMLLQKTPEEIENIAQKTLEGHIRGVGATLTIKELHGDREKVASSIGMIAAEDLLNIGINVVSCVIRTVTVSDDGADGSGEGSAGNPTQAALFRAQVELLEKKIAELEARLGIHVERENGKVEDEEPPAPPMEPMVDDLPPPAPDN